MNFQYTLLCIEEVKQGLYYYPRKEVWFKWDYDQNNYVLLKKKPEKFNNIGSFRIG